MGSPSLLLVSEELRCVIASLVSIQLAKQVDILKPRDVSRSLTGTLLQPMLKLVNVANAKLSIPISKSITIDTRLLSVKRELNSQRFKGLAAH